MPKWSVSRMLNQMQSFAFIDDSSSRRRFSQKGGDGRGRKRNAGGALNFDGMDSGEEASFDRSYIVRLNSQWLDQVERSSSDKHQIQLSLL